MQYLSLNRGRLLFFWWDLLMMCDAYGIGIAQCVLSRACNEAVLLMVVILGAYSTAG
jgi:hypothetical protein